MTAASAAGVELRSLAGTAVAAHLDAVARLRIEVFRDYPYLYDGDAGYERDYLASYAVSPDSVFVLALAEGDVVGASTGLPLAHAGDAFQRPFRMRGIDVDRVFYCGESVLLPRFRGLGLGHRFFDAREAHARALGRFSECAFAAVDRPADDPRRPPRHRDNDRFWSARGYAREPGMTLQLAWRELGERDERAHELTFWRRAL